MRCPGGKKLARSHRTEKGWLYRAQTSDCRTCPLRKRCLPETAKARVILIVDGYEALLRARRRKNRGWDEDTQRVYNRHRVYVEGAHGEGKTQHGLRRAIRRGLANVAIQVYLIAAVINLKRLAKAVRPYYLFWHCIIGTVLETIRLFMASWKRNLCHSDTCTV